MVKFLDTVLKVKLYESKEEELCVSFGLPFLCVAHKLLCTPKIEVSRIHTFQTSTF